MTMSTSKSSLKKLQAQAQHIAKQLKLPGVLPDKPRVKIGVVMDDKLITIEIDRSAVMEASEEALAAMIVREMRGEKQQ